MYDLIFIGAAAIFFLMCFILIAFFDYLSRVE